MSKKLIRTEGEIETDVTALMARADELEAKAQSEEGLSEEETAELAGIVAKLADLGQERKAVEARLKLAAVKDELKRPTTEAPRVPASIKRTNEVNPTEGLALWMKSQFDLPLTVAEHNRMISAGFVPGSTSARMPYDLGSANKRKFRRTKHSTGGAGTGAELTYKTYSQKIVEYINYNSPFVSALASESLDDGNSERTYHRLDPTALISTKTSASSGTEINPTIPEVNAVTSKVVIKPFTLTSGRFVVTYEMAKSGTVNLVDRLTEWSGASDVAAIESLSILDTGNGSNGGMQGLLSVAQAFTPSTGTTVQTVIEELYFKIPKQYRDSAIMMVNDKTMSFLVQELKDEMGRSLFEKNYSVENGLEWDRFLGKNFYVSRFMPDNEILYFVPDHFLLLFGGSAELMTFKERYWPDRAVAQVSMVSGAYLGPTGATGTVHKYEFDLGS